MRIMLHAERRERKDYRQQDRSAGLGIARYGSAGPDATFCLRHRFATYIVISIPNRKSIARGVSHFIRASYVHCVVVKE